MKLITLLSLLSFTFNAVACPNHLRMDKSDTAPCKGHFFNDRTESKIRKDVRDNQLRKEQLKLRDLQVKKLTEDRNNWKKEARNQSEAKHDMDNDLTKGFLYGIGLTLAVLFGAKQLSK